MGEQFPNAFNPDGRKEYEQDLPEWKQEGKDLQAIKMMVIHDVESNEYYPIFVYSENEEESLKAEYGAFDSQQKIEDLVVL
ncbi:MAG: hypothetical protein WC564_05190 [Patescibacteria group bacterium]|jgi:hypothetical protein